MAASVLTKKDIYGLAATLCSDTQDVFSTAEAQLQMIKCMLKRIEDYLEMHGS